MTDKEKAFLKKWEQTRDLGFWAFLLVGGALSMGLPIWGLVTLLNWLFDLQIGAEEPLRWNNLLVSLLFFWALGMLIAWLLWQQNEAKYRRLKKR